MLKALLFHNVVLKAEALDKINRAGNEILSIIYVMAYWVILIKMILDIVGHLKAKDKKAITETVLGYILIYAALFFAPFAMKLIEGIFK